MRRTQGLRSPRRSMGDDTQDRDERQRQHHTDTMPAEPGHPAHGHRHGSDQPRDSGAGNHSGHEKHAGHSVAMFRDKFWVSLALTIPTLVWGHMLQTAFGYHAQMFPGARWIPAAFG